ncbi:MAG: HAMP domain-containing sensor histidine kinase [Pseudomonadota bacterium]
MDMTTLGAAAKLLVERDFLGLVWLDEKLVAISKTGRLTDNVPLDRNVCQSLVVLANLEPEILALRNSSNGAPLELANVGVQNEDGQVERLNYLLTWSDASSHYLLTIAKPIAASDSIVALHQQTRMKMMAEAEVARQAQAIQQANLALAEANQNLDEFTRIITHDLKAPMRALRYFADDLEYALGGTETTEAREHLGKLKAQSQRMSLMVSSLLNYTQLENTSDEIEDLDTGALVDEIIASLPLPYDFVIEKLGDWPRIATLRAPLDLILRNLLQNAIQHHDEAVGCIQIGCTEGAHELKIAVSDNGPGIPARYREAVFNPFTTLAQDAPQHSGMGLTLVKRAADKIGAKLKLLENNDQKRGTTFELYWPITIAAK